MCIRFHTYDLSDFIHRFPSNKYVDTLCQKRIIIKFHYYYVSTIQEGDCFNVAMFDNFDVRTYILD